jgi:hypothetical protein
MKPPTTPTPLTRDDEPEIRARFTEFQKALEGNDAERLWAMLSSQARADAERAARSLRAEYEKTDAATKAKLVKELGLPDADLAQLTGRDLVKTKPFQKRYEEVRKGKYEKASVQSDNATVHFRDEEGDQEKLILLREEGQWKLWLKIPTAQRTADKPMP